MKEQLKYDYLEPIEVAKGVYWIGFYDEKATFHCNPYLLIDSDEAVVFDPGSVTDYPKVASKICSVVDPERINDNGRGIPAEDQGKVFEKFYQIEKFFTGNVEGAGLGLALVKRLVSAYGGRLKLKSEIGQGATFTVILPA